MEGANSPEHALIRAFKFVDVNMSGDITGYELQSALDNLHIPWQTITGMDSMNHVIRLFDKGITTSQERNPQSGKNGQSNLYWIHY